MSRRPKDKLPEGWLSSKEVAFLLGISRATFVNKWYRFAWLPTPKELQVPGWPLEPAWPAEDTRRAIAAGRPTLPRLSPVPLAGAEVKCYGGAPSSFRLFSDYPGELSLSERLDLVEEFVRKFAGYSMYCDTPSPPQPGVYYRLRPNLGGFSALTGLS